jgi:hypothetical protein
MILIKYNPSLKILSSNLFLGMYQYFPLGDRQQKTVASAAVFIRSTPMKIKTQKGNKKVDPAEGFLKKGCAYSKH